MSAVAAAIGVAGITGAIISSNSASNAANTQAGAADRASQLQYQEFQQQQQNQQPWLAAGAGALSQMQDPRFQKSFSMSDFNQDPGYQFDLQQGQQAIDRSAAASGGLQSGGTLKAAAQYTQGMASNQYQQAYQNFNNNQTQQFNRLASTAGMGQTANGQIGQAGRNMTNMVGQNMMGAANAQGAASIAQGNAWNGALSGIGNGVMQSTMMNKFGSPYGGGLNTMGSYQNSQGFADAAGGTLSGIGNGYTMPSTAPQYSGTAPSLFSE